MREIKFRLHNRVTGNIYTYDPTWGNHGQGDGWIYALPDGEDKVRHIQIYRTNLTQVDPIDCDWYQYTGLKDRLGKEIFEGDVLKWDDGDLWEVAPVEFSEGSFRHGGEHLADWYEDCEIIGNIYQNGELLDAKIR